MLAILAEAVWTPSLVVGAVVSGGLILARILPWPKKNGNGNGTAAAVHDGEARGELRAKIEAHAEELKRQNQTDEDQWTVINGTRDRLTRIEASTEQTAKDVGEMKADLKEVLKRRSDE